MEGREARCVFETAPFLDAAECAEGSAFVLGEVAHQQLPQPLGCRAEPRLLSLSNWSRAMPATRASGIESCQPPPWLLGGAGAAEAMVPLLCLGLHAATRGSAQGSC